MSKKKKSSSNSIRISHSNVPNEIAEVRRNHLLDLEKFNKLIANREATHFTSYITPKKAGLLENDMRRFRPDLRQRRILKSNSAVSRLTSRGKFARISFEDPKREFPCRKRRARRQVLFALKLTGKGSGARRHKWKSDSYVNC